MGYAPSDDQIATFVEFTGAEQRDAINFLTREPNFEKAVQNYYDAQERGTTNSYPMDYKPVWDEREMHQGKEYGPEAKPENSYQIHSVDDSQTLGPGIFNSTLSRPPSRADMPLDDKEDTDLQHGLINSMTSSRHEGNQASFGPAQRDHYPAAQWSMVTTAQRILPDPEPKERVRMLGSPAFIKPSTEENRLPGLLTIYANIPLAREALLVRDHVQSEYGTSRDWWQGEEIRNRGIVVSTDENQPIERLTPTINEVQRLVAFLENTERAYGSSDALREYLNASRHRPFLGETDADGHLLTVWREEYKEVSNDDSLRDIFTTFAFEKSEGSLSQDHDFPILKLSIQFNSEIDSLYDVIDEILWGSWVVDAPTEVFLKPSDILTFQMTQDSKMNGTAFGLKGWPLVWYADRYLEENKDRALKMLYAQASIEEERNTLQVKQNRLEYVIAPSTSKAVTAPDLLKVVKPFLVGERTPIDELDRRDEIVASGAKYHPLDEYQSMSKHLDTIADEVLQNHEALEQAKGQLSAKKRAATDFLKQPSSNVDDTPVHRYTLRGITTDQNTTYLLANPNTSEDLLDTEVNNWDWWRIYWDTQKDNPIDLQKVSSEDVIEATRKAELATAVYANDRAVNYPRQPLPESLKNFVRADNLHFASEIEHPELSSTRKEEQEADHEWAYVQNRAFNYQPRSRNSSINSMAANMDVDMQDSFDLGTDEGYPPSYSATPPPIPPRTGEKRKAVSRPNPDNLIDLTQEPELQESGTVDLLDYNTAYDQEMKEIDSPRYHNMGVVPGGPQSGVSDSITGSTNYASEINMSDIVETREKSTFSKANPTERENPVTSKVSTIGRGG